MTRAALLLIVLGAAMTACSGGGVTTSPSATVAAVASPSPASSDEPASTPTDAPMPTPSEEPTPEPDAVLAPDTLVETIVDGLTVRRTPGTAGERIGFLPVGTVAFLLGGPEDVDGIPWYPVTGMGLPYASGCVTTPPDQPIACPAFRGWVAGANDTGDPWIAQIDPEPCPEPDITTISETGFTWRLLCWADEPITLEAWWPEIPPGAGLGGLCLASDQPGGFLYCQNINYNGLAASPEEGFTNRLVLSIDPESGLEMPERGQWIRVTGRFDHPAAQACADLADPEWEDSYGAVFSCRLQFVPTSIEALGTQP